MLGALAEMISVFVAGTWTDEHAWRFTSLSHDPFATSLDVFPEYRVRILGPILAWILGLDGVAGAWLPVLANVPLLAVVYGLSRRRGLSPGSAALAVLLTATTHVTMTSRTLLGYQDSLFFLCIVSALAVQRAWLIALLGLLATLADQRAVLVFPLVLVWHASFDPDSGLIATVHRALGLALAALVGAALHEVLAATATAEPLGSILSHLSGTFLKDLKPGYIHLSIFMALKAAWMFAMLAPLLLFRTRPAWAVIAAGSGALLLLASLIVADTSRGAAFLYPLALLGILELARADGIRAENYLRACVYVNLLSPFYQGQNSGLWIVSYPLPVELLRRISGVGG